jgi:hypothetical protein
MRMIQSACTKVSMRSTCPGPLQEAFIALYHALDVMLRHRNLDLPREHIEEVTRRFRGKMDHIDDSLLRNIVKTIVAENDRYRLLFS